MIEHLMFSLSLGLYLYLVTDDWPIDGALSEVYARSEDQLQAIGDFLPP